MPTRHAIPNLPGAYYQPAGKRAATAILFHGFKGSGAWMCDFFKGMADKFNIVLIAPNALGDMWSAHDGSADMQRVEQVMLWADETFGVHTARRLCALGHSYGTRMAAVWGTHSGYTTSVALAHGRFVPEDLGKRQLPASFTGSGQDTQFKFSVLKQLAPSWPAPYVLQGYKGDHFPGAEEQDAIGSFIVNQLHKPKA